MAEAKITLSAVDQTKAAVESAKRNLLSLSEIANQLSAAFVGLSSVGALAGLISTFRESANAIDAFNDLADATGASIENISALDDVALRTGTTFETVGAALVKFNASLKDAKPGSDAEQALTALGVRVEELRRLDPAEALLRTARALSGFADDGNKARITQELFGKSLREVAPFLKDLAEKGELVAVTTKAQADEAERFNKQLFELKKNSADTARALTSDLLPVLNRIFQDYNKGGISSVLGFDRTSEKVNLIGLVQEMKSLDGYLTKLKNDQTNGIGYFGSPEKIASEIARITAQLEDAKIKFKAADAAFRGTDKLTSEAGAGRGRINPDLVRPSLPSLESMANKQADHFADNFINQLITEYAALIGNISKTDEVTRKLDTSTEKFSATERQRAMQMAGLIDAQKLKIRMTEYETKTLQEFGSIQEAAQSTYADQLRGLREGAEAQSFEASLIGKTADQVERLRIERALSRQVIQAESEVLDQVNRGLITEIEGRRRLAAIQGNANETRKSLETMAAASRDTSIGVSSAIADYMEKAAKAGDAAKDATKRTLSGMEDALVEFSRTGKLSISGLVDDMINEFIRLNAVRPLMMSIFGGGGTGASLLSSFFGGFRAEGGLVSSSKAYIVGERGPELFVPGSSGSIVPNKALQSSAPSVTLVNNFNGPADATQVLTAAQLGAAMAEARIRDQMQRGRM